MKINIEKTFLLLLIIASALYFGLSYGVHNQNTYLINGLTLVDPTFLEGDWFANNTKHYNTNFSYVILLVESIGLPISLGVVFIEVLLRILALTAIYKIVSLITDKKALIAFCLVITLILFENTASVATSYIFSTILQPSSFGAAFLLVSVYFFLRGNYFLSGLCMAFSGFMHTNFLLLGFVVYGIAHLFLGFKGIVKRSLLQFSLMLVVFAFNIPLLLSLMSSENGEQATYIFQFVRSPHHYVPNNFLPSFIKFFGWSLLGLVGFKLLKIDSNLKKKLFGLYSGLLIPIVIATLLTTVVFIPVVSKLFFWRLAPFCVLIAQIVFVTSIVRNSISENMFSNIQKITTNLFIFLGIIIIYSWYIYMFGISSGNTIIVLGIFIFLLFINFKKDISKILRIDISQNITKSTAIALALVLLIYGFNSSFLYRSSLLNDHPGALESELYQWVKNTDVSSQFLIPPDLDNFRLHGERSIIVDWKSTPIDSDGLIEWYERIEDISGKEDVHSFEEVMKGYLNLDMERLKSLKNEYALSYAVLYAGENSINYNLPTVFKNSKFIVIDLKSL